MQEYRSVHLQKNLGEALASAEVSPVVLLNRGQPRAVVMSAHEFRRLKDVAGEAVPDAVLPRVPKTVRVGQAVDPLGYETSDFSACALAMAADMLAGTKADAVAAEAARAIISLSR